MKTKDEIEDELWHLRTLKKQLEKEIPPNLIKLTLLEMRIDTLEWVVGED